MDNNGDDQLSGPEMERCDWLPLPLGLEEFAIEVLVEWRADWSLLATYW